MGAETKQVNWAEGYARHRSSRDAEFKASWEEETAILALVRARNDADLTQTQLADRLQVSQAYISQVELGTKPMSLSLMVRYAQAVGVTIQFTRLPPNAA